MAKVNVNGLEVELDISELRELLRAGDYGSIARAPAAPAVEVPPALPVPPVKLSARDKTQAVSKLGFMSVTYVVSALRHATSCDEGARLFPDFIQANDWLEYFDSRTTQERDLLNVTTSVAGTISRMGERYAVNHEAPLRAINSDVWLAVYRKGVVYENMTVSLELMRKRLHGVRGDDVLQEKMWQAHLKVANATPNLRKPWRTSADVIDHMFPLLNDLWPVVTPPAPTKEKR